MRVVFIGAGNLATRLSLEMKRAGITIDQVYSQTEANAKVLAAKLGALWTNSLDEIVEDADIYIFSLKDSALCDVINRMKPNNALWVHTAGSIPISVFAGYSNRFGVIYPLQTFSKEREVDLKSVPFFLEASNSDDAKILSMLAGAISQDVRFLSSEKRSKLHLAAVFACNFVNHIYSLAGYILADVDIPFDVLLPLIDETAKKIHLMSPSQAQTGPAIRYDQNVINRHLSMLDDPDMKDIYSLISNSIHKEASHE